MDSKSKNGLLRLDILEYYINQSKGNKEEPRYKKTKDIYSSLERKEQLPKIEDAENEIFQLKKDVSAKKIHYCISAITNNLKKARKVILKNHQDEDSFNDEILQILAHQKTVKLAEKVFNLKKNSYKVEFLPTWIFEAFNDKDNQYNSSKFYRDSSEAERRLMSKLFNNKLVVTSIDSCNDSLRLICGPVEKKDKAASNTTNREKIKQKNETEKEKKDPDTKKDIESDDEDVNKVKKDIESDDEDVNKVNKDFLGDAATAEGRKKDFDVFEDEQDYSMYDDMVMASDLSDISEDDLDTNVNYNEVTDEEPSEEEESIEHHSEVGFFDFESAEKTDDKKKEKEDSKKVTTLPALQQGYISGGESESDLEKEEANDEVLKNLRKVKKNRRGQRARQKIWEQKYGKNANHVKKETERMKSERERKQLEYEERVRKRAEKARLAEERFKNDSENANNTPLGKRKPKTNNTDKEKPMHPSWIAKRQAEKQLSKSTFSGKKVKFD